MKFAIYFKKDRHYTFLEHPKCKLFITHGGCNSITESLWNGVPMVTIPLFADQGDGAARIRKKSCGGVVLKRKISAENIFNTALNVLTNETYKFFVPKNMGF